ncbi:hypothetical protein SPRG_07752 [Saprolegnia parasitica CBS 223.65]|uniref:START domain-containing protein n=1 Tax=Saprolegnia parasitica (strain CBS 223.65) TaxID=695850 RepID=A0A067CKF3_SAPPC|nr:hypothetical protein SPRG_07752 [Saprolegnia parasitica CBS 223.65]KDO27041.1 hypothetical protein SPRG_07752 [Saprolegnia parasitica CBS 223.65]|eukprot:XP_012202136.1 hypothetical protein SPRG_07752 [Saprolegnia parasitica CBS 223.65]
MERYLNRARAESFLMDDGQEVEASVLLRIPAAEAYALWLRQCWGGPAQVGATRSSYQGTEKLSVLAPPDHGNESDRIGSVHYELASRGLFFHGYKAMVSFIPDAKNTANTLVVWVVKYDPTQTSIVLCCGGTMLRLLTRNYLKNQLQGLQ